MTRIIDRLTDRLGRAIAWLTLAMALITVTVVVLRYAFDQGAIFLQEAVMYMYGMVFMLGIPYTLKENGHVRVDIFYSRLSERGQARIDLTGHLLFLVPVSAVIFWYSLPYVIASWSVTEGSAEVGGIPGIFLLKTLLPVFAFLLFVQGLAEICNKIVKLAGYPTETGAEPASTKKTTRKPMAVDTSKTEHGP